MLKVYFNFCCYDKDGYPSRFSSEIIIDNRIDRNSSRFKLLTKKQVEDLIEDRFSELNSVAIEIKEIVEVNPICLTEAFDEKLAIGDVVRIKRNIGHDRPYWGKIGKVKEYIYLDEVEYYIDILEEEGKHICRFSYDELTKLEEPKENKEG